MRCHHQDRALPKKPPAGVVRQGHAPEVATDDVRYPIVFREAIVDKRVVGRHQVEHAAIFVDDALEEEFGFTLKGLTEIVVEVGKLVGVRNLAAQVP